MTNEESVEIIAMLATAFPVPAWTDETYALYAEYIVDLDASPTLVAIERIIRTCENGFRPTVAALRAAVKQELERRRAIPGDLPAEEAWGYVIQQFGDTGRYRPFPETHPLVAQAVRCIGWEVLCDSENPEASRAHFWRVYGALLGRAQAERLAQPGLCLPEVAPNRIPSRVEPLRLESDVGRQKAAALVDMVTRTIGAGAARAPIDMVIDAPTAQRIPTVAEEQAAQERKRLLRAQLEALTKHA